MPKSDYTYITFKFVKVDKKAYTFNVKPEDTKILYGFIGSNLLKSKMKSTSIYNWYEEFDLFIKALND